MKPSDKERETRRAVQAQRGLQRRAEELGESRRGSKLTLIQDERIRCHSCQRLKGRTSYPTASLLLEKERRLCSACLWSPEVVRAYAPSLQHTGGGYV